MFDLKYIDLESNALFDFLVKEKGFSLVKIEAEADGFECIFRSSDLQIRLESYRLEIYSYISNVEIPDEEVNLFNMLGFLNRDSTGIQNSNYFPSEQNLKQNVRLQLEWISRAIEENYDAIFRFVLIEDFKENQNKLRDYMVVKHPDLFGK